jgi:hypothetical protein
MLRVLIPAYGPQEEPLRVAFRTISNLVKSRPELRDVVLLFYAKVNFKDRMVAKLIGPSKESTLLAGQAVPFVERATVRLATLRTMEKLSPPDAVVLFYASYKLLDKVEAIADLQALIVVPWTIQRIEKWVLRRVPLLPGTPVIPEGLTIPSPELTEALWALTVMVNPEAPLTLNSETGAAMELLELLRSNGLWVKPAEFKKWAIRNGWSEEGAGHLAELAKRVGKGEKVEPGVHWGFQALSYFKALAEIRAENKAPEINLKRGGA